MIAARTSPRRLRRSTPRLHLRQRHVAGQCGGTCSGHGEQRRWRRRHRERRHRERRRQRLGLVRGLWCGRSDGRSLPCKSHGDQCVVWRQRRGHEALGGGSSDIPLPTWRVPRSRIHTPPALQPAVTLWARGPSVVLRRRLPADRSKLRGRRSALAIAYPGRDGPEQVNRGAKGDYWPSRRIEHRCRRTASLHSHDLSAVGEPSSDARAPCRAAR